jgi:hypothetical protein
MLFAAFTTSLVAYFWPLSVDGPIPLGTCVAELLRRSKTGYSTLLVALFYLFLLKEFTHDTIKYGRRMFLSALILAEKYLQDGAWSITTWGKFAGLSTSEIGRYQKYFLQTINYQLHMPKEAFCTWTSWILHVCASKYLNRIWIYKIPNITIGNDLVKYRTAVAENNEEK